MEEQSEEVVNRSNVKGEVAKGEVVNRSNVKGEDAFWDYNYDKLL